MLAEDLSPIPRTQVKKKNPGRVAHIQTPGLSGGDRTPRASWPASLAYLLSFQPAHTYAHTHKHRST